MSLRLSPVHDALDRLSPEWRERLDMPAAIRIGDGEEERRAAADLALCDLSFLTTFGVKGPSAFDWLQGIGAPAPLQIHERQFFDDGAMVARLKSDEFMIMNGFEGDTTRRLADALGAGVDGAWPVLREDAIFLVIGERWRDVFAQTCSIELDPSNQQICMTRVAGVSCGLLSAGAEGTPAYRVWTAPSLALSLWEYLETIVNDLHGRVIGIGALPG